MQRFTGIDPLAETYSFQSPYNYAINNPTTFIDYLGLGPIYGPDGTLIGYEVEEGQGPTQIAQDLNENYGCEMTCEITYTDIVQDNSDAFPNGFNDDGTVKDRSDDAFKSGNIEPGQELVINGGIEGGENGPEVAKNLESIASAEKSIDSLNGIIDDSKATIKDVLNSPMYQPTPGDDGTMMGPLRTIKMRPFEKKIKRDKKLIQGQKRKIDSLKNVNKKLKPAKNDLRPVKG